MKAVNKIITDHLCHKINDALCSNISSNSSIQGAMKYLLCTTLKSLHSEKMCLTVCYVPNCPTKTEAAWPGTMTGWRWLAAIRGEVVTLVEHKLWPGLCSGTDEEDWVEGFEARRDGNWPDVETEALYLAVPMPAAWTATTDSQHSANSSIRHIKHVNTKEAIWCHEMQI